METPKNWKQCNMSYNVTLNIVKIDAYESDFVPEYLNYLLEYYDIPKNAKRIFKEDKP